MLRRAIGKNYIKNPLRNFGRLKKTLRVFSDKNNSKNKSNSQKLFSKIQFTSNNKNNKNNNKPTSEDKKKNLLFQKEQLHRIVDQQDQQDQQYFSRTKKF